MFAYLLPEAQHAVPFITVLGILFKALLRNNPTYGEFTTKFAIRRFGYIELQMFSELTVVHLGIQAVLLKSFWHYRPPLRPFSKVDTT